jgi:SAM-dependent methyltransferase
MAACVSATPLVRLACPACSAGILTLQGPVCRSCGYAALTRGRIVILHQDPTPDYSADVATVQASVAESHFWFGARRAMVITLLRRWLANDAARHRTFVDFGCGNGQMMAALESDGWNVVGVDMHPEVLSRTEKITTGGLVCSRIDTVRFAQPIDAAGLFDVIEHAADDQQLLRHVQTQLRPGGHLIVSVPALPSLWSPFDDHLRHKRRYTRTSLIRAMEGAGLSVLTVTYAFSYAVPAIWMQRRVFARRGAQRLAGDYYQRPSRWLNATFATMSGAERWLIERGIGLPFGTSLFGIGRVSG